MTISATLARQLAGRFREAERALKPVKPISLGHPDFTVDDAYRVQGALVKIFKGEGWTPSGIKVGATKTDVQEKFATGGPVCSVMFRERQCANGGVIAADRLTQPKIEPEIALRMGRPLAGPGVTRERAMAAIGGVSGAFEVVDCHTENWQVGAVELIADNCVNAGYVLGDEMAFEPGLDLAAVTVEFSRNDGRPNLGSGAAALGDPVKVLVWLANWLGQRGRRLETDWVVITGGIADPFPVERGDRFEARFSTLPPVAVSVA